MLVVYTPMTPPREAPTVVYTNSHQQALDRGPQHDLPRWRAFPRNELAGARRKLGRTSVFLAAKAHGWSTLAKAITKLRGKEV